jgi:hypothetical protein
MELVYLSYEANLASGRRGRLLFTLRSDENYEDLDRRNVELFIDVTKG